MFLRVPRQKPQHISSYLGLIKHILLMEKMINLNLMGQNQASFVDGAVRNLYLVKGLINFCSGLVYSGLSRDVIMSCRPGWTGWIQLSSPPDLTSTPVTVKHKYVIKRQLSKEKYFLKCVTMEHLYSIIR